MKHIFNEEQQKKATFILENPLAKLSELYSNEIKDLAVVWCYYSGKIEGNTYTYVETEDYSQYANYFLNRQIERMKDISNSC